MHLQEIYPFDKYACYYVTLKFLNSLIQTTTQDNISA